MIEQAKPMSRDGFLFPSVRKGVISDATMARMMERRGMQERPHGFRSSSATGAPRPPARRARSPRPRWRISTAARSSARTAARITSMERRRLMERWAGFVIGRTAEVV